MGASKSLVIGLAWAAIAILIWSGSLVMLRLGVTTTLNAYDLTALRFGVSALVLSPFMFKQSYAWRSLGLPRIIGMIIGFGAPYILLVSYGLTFAPSNAAGALNPGMMAFLVVLASWRFFKDQLNFEKVIGIAAILIGVALFTSITVVGRESIGHLIFVISATMWASYVLIVRQSEVPALQATVIVAVGSAIIYLPIYIVVLPKGVLDAPMADIFIQSMFHGVLVSVIAVFAFTRSAELLGPLASATLPALIPLTTMGLGFIVLGETASIQQIVGAIIVGIGVMLTMVRLGSLFRR